MGGWGVGGRCAAAAAGFGLAGLLAGCVGSTGFEPPSVATPTLGERVSNLLAFNSLKGPGAIPQVSYEEKPTCPDIQVLDGTASSRAFGSAGQGNADVRYQFSLGDVVRECARAGDKLTLKVGAEGRALLGPAGAAGALTAPLRIAVRSGREDKVVYSKLYAVPVTIAPGTAGAEFSVVSDTIAVPFVSMRSNDDYDILVGFDAKGTDVDKAAAGAKRARRG